MKINDPAMTPEQRLQISAAIVKQSEVMRDLLIAAADRGVKYLILTNGGAAVALLSFMGAKPELRENPASWNVLWWFALGVILCGVLVAVAYFQGLSLIFRWSSDYRRYFAGELGYRAVFDTLETRARRTWWIGPAFGVAAFIALLMGCYTAYRDLRPQVPPQDPPRVIAPISPGAAITGQLR